MSTFAPTWAQWLAVNWPTLLVWNEIRGAVHALVILQAMGVTP